MKMIKFYIFKLFSFIYKFLNYSNNRYNCLNYIKKYNFSPTVSFGKVTLEGRNIFIGKHTYINSGLLQVGKNSKITIGEWCAIGYNVTILAITHDTIYSTGPIENRPFVEKDIVIGNHVWIGTNVFIKEGVTIGNNSIIGANSVVTKNVLENEIVGGIPAKHIKFK
jgi:maltose O-acetyltransferase